MNTYTFLQVEWVKNRGYVPFWILCGMIVLSFLGMSLLIVASSDASTLDEQTKAAIETFAGSPFTFPNAWNTFAYMLSFLLPLVAVLVMMNMGNEWNSRMARQLVIEGWSRTQFILSKLLWVLLISLFAWIVYFFSVALLAKGHFSMPTAAAFRFLLLLFSQLSFAFLLSYFVRKTFLALGIFLAYMWIVESLLMLLFEKYHLSILNQFLFLECSDSLLLPPEFFRQLNAQAYDAKVAALPRQTVITIVETCLFWGICFWHIKRRDL